MSRSKAGRAGSIRREHAARPWFAAGALLAAMAMGATAARAEWRALVVGAEAGGSGTPGAVASATDLAAVLRARGTADVTLLLDAEARPAALGRAMDDLVRRTQSGDTVLFAFDGRGRGDEGARGPGALAMALLPPGADAGEALGGDELAGFIRHVEARGARAVLVADASFGAATTRSHAPGAAPAGSATGLIKGPEGSAPFARSLVLAASDPRFASKAIHVPGVEGPRRALTYAVARALEGRADFDHDGAISIPELVAYTARLTYQLSNQRQKLAAVWPGDSRPATTRGIVIRATAPLGELAPPDAAPQVPLLRATGSGEPFTAPAGPPIRLAAATGSAQQLAGVAPREGAVQAVGPTDDPDLIWDPGNRDVITPDGDLIAEDVGAGDLDGVVDRTMALRQVKAMMIEAPQQVALLPNDEVQHRGNLVKIEIANAGGRYLVLFNIRSDGAVQPLYPLPDDPPLVTTPSYTLPLSVSPPLGADQIVAVTATEPMTAIENGLAGMSGQKTPMAAVRLLRDHAATGALIGSVSVFSGTP